MRERKEEEEKWKQKYEDWLTICYVSFSSLSLLDIYLMGQRVKKRSDSLSSEEKLNLAMAKHSCQKNGRKITLNDYCPKWWCNKSWNSYRRYHLSPCFIGSCLIFINHYVQNEWFLEQQLCSRYLYVCT